MNAATAYRVTNTMPADDFAALLLSIVRALYDARSAGDAPEYTRAGAETVGHVIACMLAQRFGEGIGACDVVESLGLESAKHPRVTKARIAKLIKAMEGDA